jgi:hypothetical protein
VANLTRIQREDGERQAAMARAYLIDRLDECFKPTHPLGRLLKDLEKPLQDIGMSPVDVMQRIQVALFPEEFLPDEEVEEMKRLARNKKHQTMAGMLPGSTRMAGDRLAALIEKTLKKKAA